MAQIIFLYFFFGLYLSKGAMELPCAKDLGVVWRDGSLRRYAPEVKILPRMKIRAPKSD